MRRINSDFQTQGSDLGSAPEDDELRFTRPQGSDSSLASADGLHLAQTRGSDSTSATDDRLDLGFGGASTSPNLERRPATSTGGAIITLPRADSGLREYTGGGAETIWPHKSQLPQATRYGNKRVSIYIRIIFSRRLNKDS